MNIQEILNKYKKIPENILSVMEDIQEEFKYLPEEYLKKISIEFKLPLSQIYSLATFYKTFSLKPKGKHHICVCMGTACHIRGSQKILEKIQEKLKIKSGETSPDGKYSLETVNCLGACALGPLVVIDNNYHGKMTQNKIEKIFEKK